MRQISTKEALAKLMMGQEVKILIPGAVADDWTEYSPAYLSEDLDGVIFFADGADPEKKEDLAEEPKEEPAEQKQEPEKKKKTRKGGRRARDWDEARILDMYASGATLEAIAKEFHCTTAPIRKIVAKVYADANGKLPHGSKREINHEIDTGKIVALYTAGWNIKDIAGDMHMEAVEVSKIIEKMEREEQKTDEVSEG